MNVNCLTVPEAGAKLVPSTLERRELRADDCLIEIRWAGICHSDIHTVNGDWLHDNFPMTPGHEIVGRITETGPAVENFHVGDVVGIGCMVDSCGECHPCKEGDENYCENGMTGTYNGVDRVDGSITQGGYATHIVCREAFLVRVPEAFSDLEDPATAAVAPLLCAGVTTYEPLANNNVGPGSRVGIIGMGGLGHVAVKLAAAMGAEVTVFSRTDSKKADGLAYGAKNYVATAEKGFERTHRNSLDLIICTVSAEIPLHPYLSMLDQKGTMVMLGLPNNPLKLPVGDLVNQRRTITGSLIGGIERTQEMLDFCAEHGVTAETELIDASEANEAYTRVLDADVRYRAVIDARTF